MDCEPRLEILQEQIKKNEFAHDHGVKNILQVI